MSEVETLVTQVKQGSWYNGYSAIACHARVWEFFSADCDQIVFIEYIKKKNTLIIANYATIIARYMGLLTNILHFIHVDFYTHSNNIPDVMNSHIFSDLSLSETAILTTDSRAAV